ncbi:DUF1275 domain-containing protein [Cellulomonas dongxiuzhuiae]|uniref:DUF1275 domain-containing protein n=1 Tax=Cellulomonas dongxiuzhuiae TaxID=2819979 RepID=A0ABX8GHT0_9CELL|nr:DUF1275 domain-containing protein [Cellulomonas dongxiuzhuiae]QWC15437.1 DUF1275 domain-containing protein [Cellulomonas dongxiuzhuiae]
MRRPTAGGLFTSGLLLLTAATGATDAVSYLALDGVFTGNMTGNVLFLAFALVGVPDMPLLNNGFVLAGFALGSVLGGRVVGPGHPAGLPTRSACCWASGRPWSSCSSRRGRRSATCTPRPRSPSPRCSPPSWARRSRLPDPWATPTSRRSS